MLFCSVHESPRKGHCWLTFSFGLLSCTLLKLKKKKKKSMCNMYSVLVQSLKGWMLEMLNFACILAQMSMNWYHYKNYVKCTKQNVLITIT